MGAEYVQQRTIPTRVTFFLLALSAMYVVPVASAQEATVTFYAGGQVSKLLLPASKTAVFGGYIFDDQKAITAIWRSHYITVRLPAGPHVFSASTNSKHPAKNSQLPLTLEADKSYFVRAETEVNGIVVVASEKGRLDVVPCET